MKYIKSFFAPIFVLLFLFSCNDGIVETRTPPTPTDESISGSAFYDIDGDSTLDGPMTGSIVIIVDSLYSISPKQVDSFYQVPGMLASLNILATEVDVDGNYIFQGVQNMENQALRIFPVEGYLFIVGRDNTPDGDDNEVEYNEYIGFYLDEDEHDDGNDFVALQFPNLNPSSSITGHVFIDENMDLIGDVPAENHRMELYERNANGVPTGQPTMPLFVDYTDADGHYEFKEIPNGQYVIYHIGTGDYPYTCVSNMDETPETGEPTFNAGCQFIPVNLSDLVTEDHDNVYVIDVIESTEPGKFGGVIYEDITSDGQPDIVSDVMVTVEIYERDNDGFKMGPVIYSTTSNIDGTFSIDNIAPGNYVATLNDNAGDYNTIYGYGGSGGSQPLPNAFTLDIAFGDEFLNAEFWIWTSNNIPSIHGDVTEDLNGDGIGDDYLYNHAVELYLRDSNDLPTGNILYQTNTSSGGQFFFTNLSTGSYVLVLTGPSNYSCSSSGDETPESGEPVMSTDCRHILVNFEEGVEDEDNFYILQQ